MLGRLSNPRPLDRKSDALTAVSSRHPISRVRCVYTTRQVRMRDVHTGDELLFHCQRWLSRDEDDGEICRELPALRDDVTALPGETDLHHSLIESLVACRRRQPLARVKHLYVMCRRPF